MERLLETLRTANLPVQYLTGFSKETLGIIYSGDPTKETLQAVDAILATYDWSDEAEKEWVENKKRQEIVTSIDSDEAIATLVKSLQQMVFNSVKIMTEKMNEIILKISDGKVEPMPITKDITQLVEDLKVLIATKEVRVISDVNEEVR